MSDQKPLVAVVMGSVSDKETMMECVATLRELGIPFEARVSSAHRMPQETRVFAESAAQRGVEVIIAGAGMAAHLAGFIAAHTLLPVIGVPIDSSALHGMDALLSTVQMPPGIPVAVVSLGKGGARNAAILAAQILAGKHTPISESLRRYRENLTKKAVEQAETFTL